MFGATLWVRGVASLYESLQLESLLVDIINGGSGVRPPTVKLISPPNVFSYTVESLLTETPNKGHCIKYLSTMEKTKSPNFNPLINWNLLIEDSLYSGQTT